MRSSLTGTGQESESQVANSNPLLWDRILQCQAEKGKFPNFITLDFYELGDGLSATNTINGIDPLGVTEAVVPMRVYPNPFANHLEINHNGYTLDEISMFDSKDVNVMADVTVILSHDVLLLETTALSQGIYLLQLGEQIIKVTKL